MDISVGWDSSYLTQNDFNAVRTQLHNEVVDLTNVLLYMVDGSTNMKDIIASGNSNTALALLGAASNITANLNEPNLQSTPAEVSPWNIVSMIGSGLTTAAAFGTDGLVNPADIEGLNDTVDLVADLFSDAAGAGGGFTTAGTSSSTGLPSADYQLATTLGQLANSDLQSGMLAGFDATLDSITGDWGKLHEIGPLIADPTQKVFFSPNQVLQNATITLMTQASQRSLYLSLLPAFYQLHYWPQVVTHCYQLPGHGLYLQRRLEQLHGVLYRGECASTPKRDHLVSVRRRHYLRALLGQRRNSLLLGLEHQSDRLLYTRPQFSERRSVGFLR